MRITTLVDKPVQLVCSMYLDLGALPALRFNVVVDGAMKSGGCT